MNVIRLHVRMEENVLMNIWLSHVTAWEQITLVISVKSHCILVSLLIIVHASLSFTAGIVHVYNITVLVCAYDNSKWQIV